MSYCIPNVRRVWWFPLLAVVLCWTTFVVETGGIAFASNSQSGSGQPKFSLAPVYVDPGNPESLSYFIMNTRAGALAQNALRVTNVGDQPGTVGLIAADGSTAQTTGIVYTSADKTRNVVGSWLSLSMNNLTLAPGQSKVVQVKINTPKGEAPGQYIGGIIAQDVVQQTTNGNSSSGNVQFNMKLIHQQIIAVEVNVVGKMTQQLAATGIEAGIINGNQALSIALNNTGNTLLAPHGSLQILDAHGKVLQRLALTMDIILPGSSIKYPVSMRGQPLATGTYRAALALVYGQNHMLNYTTAVSVVRQLATSPEIAQQPSSSSFPWPVVIGLLVGLLLAGGLLVGFRTLAGARSGGTSSMRRSRPRQRR